MRGRLLGGLGRALVVAGLFILGFVAYQLWGTNIEASRNQDDLTHQLAHDTGSTRDGDDLGALTHQLASVDPATAPPTPPPAEGDPVGVITIDKIGLEAVIVEGVDRADLKKGPGHYPSSPLPGQAGNAAIAGHRTTYGAPFNRIDELVPGDEIVVTTPQGRFLYKVRPAPDGTGQPEGQAWWAVAPNQTEVLRDTGDNLLTLTACHPKYSARQRIIVQAELSTPVAPTSPPPVQSASSSAKQLDEGLGGDSSAWPIALAFLAGAFLVALLARWLGHRWRRWPVYLLAAVPVLALIWCCYVYLDRYLPAL